MNIIKIIIKDIKHNLRNRGAMILMVLFPIVLMSILGLALSGVFEGEKINFNTKVIYSSTGIGNLEKAFEGFESSLKNMGVQFLKINNEEDGIKSVKDAAYNAYIKIDEKENKLTLYKNNRFDFSAGLIESSLSSFVDRYNLYYEISKVNPAALNEIVSSKTNSELVKTVGLEKNRAPRAKDYYAVTMLTLIILYSSMTASYGIIKERVRKTYNRVLISPIKRYEFFIGKLFGSVILTIFQMIVVVLFSKYVLNAYLGENMLIFGLIILSEIIMAVSLGQGIAFLVKNETAANGLLNAIIPIIVLLGGGYFPLEQFGSNILTTIAQISPLKWINDALFNVIYSNDYSKVLLAILINLMVAVVFLMAASIKYREEKVS
ncbi:ABC transporter permease [Candidatus Clostridium stratigraminis]|uniref:ABC transporter permease n=1 Tax=Candidatus Clostridium stratigraminis TaxID=3381661 RepID=A0ABW8T032_9CLOT